MLDKSKKSPVLPVTDSSLKPGDFPIGSVESRAAARALSTRKRDSRERINVIFTGGCEIPHATPWAEDVHSGEKLVRALSVPAGMSVEEAERIVDAQEK